LWDRAKIHVKRASFATTLCKMLMYISKQIGGMQLVKSSTLLLSLLPLLLVAPASAQYAAFRALDPAAVLEMLADGGILITPSSSFVRPGAGTAHTNFHLFHPAQGLPTASPARRAALRGELQ
jgi:hypothetical protein